MKHSSRRPQPLLIAAILNIVLFCGAVAALLASFLSAAETPAPRIEAPALSEESPSDPPPLTPIIDPTPHEPRPVQQIVDADTPPDPQHISSRR